MNKASENSLIKTVARLAMQPKGILAIDESLAACNKRFEKFSVSTTEEKRREYRELLVTAPDIEKYISGFILFDETIRQKTKNGENFTSVLKSKGIEIGIKVDQGLKDFGNDKGLPAQTGEKITLGLSGLKERLEEYKSLGATFAKWRAVYTISDKTPGEECMKENAKLFGQYAILCQELDIVPIVEPEVLIDGNHSMEKCYEVTARNLDVVFIELKRQNVFIPGMILKTSMVLGGKDSDLTLDNEEIAKMTVQCLKEHVPADIGGIVFLSGGQGDEEAVLRLNAMHKMGPLPWPLTFSYGRAIQNGALKSWAKNPSDVSTAQALLLKVAGDSSQASIGEYK